MGLLAEPLEFRFEDDDAFGDETIVGFGADGIDLAVHFLGEEIECASDGFGGFEAIVELFEMTFETGEFFGDIATVREEDDLFEQAIVVGVDALEAGGFEFFDELITMFACDLGCLAADGGDGGAHDLDSGIEITCEVSAFFFAHSDEGGEGGIGGGFEAGPERFGVVFGFGGFEDPGEAQQRIETEGWGDIEFDGQFTELLDVGFGEGSVHASAGVGVVGEGESDFEGETAAADALGDELADAGFERIELAGQIDHPFGLLAVD